MEGKLSYNALTISRDYAFLIWRRLMELQFSVMCTYNFYELGLLGLEEASRNKELDNLHLKLLLD